MADPRRKAKKKRKKQYEEGRAFVDRTMDFHVRTIAIVSKMPKRLRPYLLDPVFEASEDALDAVSDANSVYMKEKDPDLLMGAWDRRISRLSDALAAFQRFERKHELLMRSVDFLSSETARLTRAFVSIAVDNGFLLPGTSTGDDLEMRYPELFVPKQDGNDNGTAAEPEPGPQGPVKTGALVIDVRASPDELSFVSADGTGRFKLGLTREGARLWLRLERAARKSVADRLSADRKERAALAAKTAAPALAGGSPSP